MNNTEEINIRYSIVETINKQINLWDDRIKPAANYELRNLFNPIDGEVRKVIQNFQFMDVFSNDRK